MINQPKQKILVAFIAFSVFNIVRFLIKLNRSHIIIEFGIKIFNKIITLLNIGIIASVITLIIIFILTIKTKINQKNEIKIETEAKKDPLYEQKEIIQKLNNLIPTIESEMYLKYIDRLFDQIQKGNELVTDFKQVIDENNQPIIQNIAKELKTIQIHILEDSKSIYRRLIVEKDGETIQSKLDHNDKLLNDADKLIVEAINYIDVKSNSTDVDLKNLTESLKDLIKMI